MGRQLATLRFLGGLMAPGGVLVLAAWAVQREDVVLHAAAPYAPYFCFGALIAAVLLSWYSDQSRLLCSASAIVLTVLAAARLVIDADIAQFAAVILLPLNLAVFAALKEHGVMRLDGALKVGLVAAQAASVFAMSERVQPTGTAAWAFVPWATHLAFGIAAFTIIGLVFRRRTKIEQGLLWALVAMFLGTYDLQPGHPGEGTDALFFFSGAAGLTLVFAVLEHGYDIAYRDELTGLPGRRAFNGVMEQLGGTYAIAMCDVDHFKTFNDTYGHDVGDQVLRMVASRLSQVGGGGRVFRYGGEEFLIVFRGRSAREAEPFVESLRRTIADTGFVLRSPDRPARKPRAATEVKQSASKVQITISIGIAERSKRHSTPELVLDAADAGLYRAKEAGRNCVKLDESSPSSLLQPV
jgi:diguanylate cyclase (GGDEF)-like protein